MSEYKLNTRGYVLAAGSSAFFSYHLSNEAKYHHDQYNLLSAIEREETEQTIHVHNPQNHIKNHATMGGATGFASVLFAVLAAATLVQAAKNRR